MTGLLVIAAVIGVVAFMVGRGTRRTEPQVYIIQAEPAGPRPSVAGSFILGAILMLMLTVIITMS